MSADRTEVPLELRDARPFLAHYLRQRANARTATNGGALQLLARWVENMPSGDARMRRIEGTGVLDYDTGGFRCGATAERLIAAYTADHDGGPDHWLDGFAEAVAAGS